MTRENRADHNAMMSYGYVLARAARKKDTVSVLDWGGGAGHYHLYSRALLPEIDVDYHCYDVPSLCRLGQKLLPDAHFHEDTSELCRRRFDLVISSSSLHYFENWREMVRSLAGATREFLYIARLQTIQGAPSFVVIQRPYRAGYKTEYPSWFLNRQEVLTCALESDLELVREFVFAEEWYVRNAPEHGDCRGFLLRRRLLHEPDPYV
jgi:putative methyltransferase (TIGR04325 family)